MHTVNEMLDRYERERLPTLSARTRAGYHRHLKRLREKFGGKDVRAVTRLEVKDFAIVPHGKIHRLKAIAVFRNAFAHAINWNWVDGNPCTLLERNQPRTRSPALSMEEFRSALKLASKTAGGSRAALVMELALHTGQTQDGIIGCRWSQVDYQAGTILFRHHRSKKKITVPITPEIAKLLDRARKMCGESEYVVTSRMNTRYTNDGFRSTWQYFLREWVQTGNDRFLFADIRQLSRANLAAKTEVATDPVDEYAQFDPVVKAQAAVNAPYYRVLFCVEQLIRQRVVETMEKAAGADWWESDKIQQSMRQEVNALVTREVDNAMTQRSMRMIDYTTLGQLGQIIRDNCNRLVTAA